MTSLVGLCAGVGLLLILDALTRPARTSPAERTATRRRAPLRELLQRAGLSGLSPARLVGVSAASAAVTLIIVTALTGSVVVAAAFVPVAAYVPVGLVRRRVAVRDRELREAWPEAVDVLVSGVRAGLSLPEAVAQLGKRGPEVLRPAFRTFGLDYQASGNFGACCDRLADALADPVGDRVVETLRLARDVGGTDLGRLLRTLSAYLREDARTRAELETRQGWTVNAAKLGVAAPWVVLLLLSLRPEAARAYSSPGGVVLLTGGLGVSVVAYRLMQRIARLPSEPRVLR